MREGLLLKDATFGAAGNIQDLSLEIVCAALELPIEFQRLVMH